MEENKSCYSFEKHSNREALIKNVDATYVIHLKDNGRYAQMYEQLQKYPITNIVYIVWNQGFQSCKKSKFIDKPPLDLVDAFLQVFKHAKIQNYNNILILEDDFILDPKINDLEHRNNMETFLKEQKNNSFIYYLGCLPFLQLPYNYYQYRVIFSVGMHACIYSKSYREKVLQIKHKKINDWDVFNNFQSIFSAYTYYTPLCYQLFPKTNNSQYWGFDNIIIFFFSRILLQFYWFLGLDKSIEPGYSLFYGTSKTLPWAILCILFLVCYKLLAFGKNSVISLRRKRSSIS